MKALLVLPLIAIAACATLPQKPPFLTGRWGGQHVALVLEGGLGTLEYDCASGTIDQAIATTPDGRFRATGTHRTGHGGPIRVGQIFTSHRATYSGTVVKDDMTLTVRLEDGTVLGPFTLVRGAEPQLTPCL